MREIRVRALVVLGVALAGAFAFAQGGLIVGGRRANFGTQRVSPGALADPLAVAVVSGGGVNARALGLGPGCVGFVTRQPDLIVQLTAQSPSLRLYVVAQDGSDVTLLVRTAAGRWRCNDDSFGGTNPTVDLPNAPAGQYDVWVGSFREGVTARAVLNVTERADRHP